MATDSSANATSCVVNALVLATPISMPAWVRKVSSDSRVRLDSALLQMVREWMFLLRFFTALSASRVSAVSPLWEMVTNRVLFKIRGLR
jgi:hypothetical protein